MIYSDVLPGVPRVLARVELVDSLHTADRLLAELHQGSSRAGTGRARGSGVMPGDLGGFALRLDGLWPAEAQWFTVHAARLRPVTGQGPLGTACLVSGSPSRLIRVGHDFIHSLDGRRQADWQNALQPALEFLAGRRPQTWQIRQGAVPLENRTVVMGILNVTPDSFSDGGRYLDPAAALDHAQAMAETGASIIDVGGESTRPGSEPVTAEEEWNRLAPVLKRLVPHVGVPVSIDTYKAEVARRALDLGVHIVNDVSGLADPAMAATVREAGAGLVIMHNARRADYQDLMTEVAWFLRSRLAAARQAGIDDAYVVLDPGLGFAKEAEHNFLLMRRLAALVSLGRPVLVGPSRKRMIGKVLGTGPDDRLEGTAALVALCAWMGASIVRVHDVAEMSRVARMLDAVRNQVWEVAADGR